MIQVGHLSMRLRLIVLNESGLPRLTKPLLARLIRSLLNADAHRLITVEGGGSVFCEGFDLEDLTETRTRDECQQADQLVELYSQLLTGIQQTSQPVIAVVDGPALGGGVGLAAACDIVVASPRASFGLPETLLGVIPAQVFPVLASRVGVPRARLLALGGRTLLATEALQWGLVDHVTDDLAGTLAHYTKRLVRMDARAITSMKELIRMYYGPPSGYYPRAVSEFVELQKSMRTHQRLTRFLSGDLPWDEDEA